VTDRSDYARGLRISVLGLLVNVGLALVKLLAGVFGRSYALIADAVESLADIVGSVVVWSGLRIASRPADPDHPYGHGKAEAVAALVVTLMLVAAGVGIAIAAVGQILMPRHVPEAFTLWVLLGVIVVKETMYRIVRRVAGRIGSGAVLVDAWHHRSDAITSAAAAIGIGVAVVGGERYAAADGWAALFASAVILVNAWRLMRAPLHELMDAEPTWLVDRVREAAKDVPGVAGIEKVLARKSGMRYWVDMHVEVDPAMSVERAHDIAHRVKEKIQRDLPLVQDVLIHIEPFQRPAPPAPT
jgi:cation diffusion facilitator family transporter